MLTLRKISPSVSLLPFVRHYEYREILSEDRVAIRPLPARPEQLLQFHLLGRFEVFDFRSGNALLAPSAIVVGPQTWRVADLLLKGKFIVFVIVFQPTGFHRLFGPPMAELTDRAYEASDVIGVDVKLLHERLQESTTLREMVCLTESGFCSSGCPHRSTRYSLRRLAFSDTEVKLVWTFSFAGAG
jgi:hypothetical protein